MKLFARLKRSKYLVGCAGAWAVYAAFYLRHPAVLEDHVKAYHAIGCILGLVSLIIVSLASGGIAMSTKPTTMWAALVGGLGAPGIIFGLSAGSAASDPGVKAAAFLVIPGSASGSVLGDSIRLVFSPVSTVETHARQQTAHAFEGRIANYEKETQQQKAQIDKSNTEAIQLRAQVKGLQSGAEFSKLSSQLTSVQAERDQLRTDVSRLKEESAALASTRERLAYLQRFRDDAGRLLELHRTERMKAEDVVLELRKDIPR